MKVPSFLLIILFTASLASGYTVVLNNGRIVRGTLVGEDSHTVQIRDEHGSFLSIRRPLIDSRSTGFANEPFVKTQPRVRKAPSEPRTLMEIAEWNRKNRQGDVPVWRDVASHGTAEITILGTPDEPGDVWKIPEDHSRIPPAEEQHWRREARSIHSSIRRLREKSIAAEAGCTRSRNRQDSALHTPMRKPRDLLSVMEETSECKLWREIHLQLKDEEYRLEDFEERARKAGVPYEWIE